VKNERGGILFRLLCLILLGGGAWFLYTQWWPQNNLRRFDGRLESAVDRELFRLGVTDRDVVGQLRKEHSQWGIAWVETQRTLQVRNDRRLHEIISGLTNVSERLGCTVENTTVESGVELSIKRYLWVMQRFTLVTSQEPVKFARTPVVAFVIDDVAYETVSMDHFASLGVPLTFAILPREKHSKQLSLKATSMHFPVMLHLPMEPLDLVHNDPGPSGLYLKMTDQQLHKQFDKDVASVPDIVGINNHMGSAFTENKEKMTLVMQWVKERGVYFLDSRTTGKSVVCKVAKTVGVPCLANETFLDNQDDVSAIEKQLDLVMNLAVKSGRTIAIGHYRRKHLVEALANRLPAFKVRGIEIVALPTLYHQ